ncbi:mucin-5AC-like isoform X8 [Sycon ciliatum]|uniref:mucin-5AC-like isoform X8 n=1 Tax=Sycon ciliatum TaxID=27933 RepID=UPI0031F68F75
MSSGPTCPSQHMCPVCREFIYKPVSLPCHHKICESCFDLIVEKSNVSCPICRARLSNWVRRTPRHQVVDVSYHEFLSANFSAEYARREKDESVLDVEVPLPVVSPAGEVRAEYEAMVEQGAEKRKQRDEMELADLRLAKRIYDEESEEHNRHLRAAHQQVVDDESLARSLHVKLQRKSPHRKNSQRKIVDFLSPAAACVSMASGLTPCTSGVKVGSTSASSLPPLPLMPCTSGVKVGSTSASSLPPLPLTPCTSGVKVGSTSASSLPPLPCLPSVRSTSTQQPARIETCSVSCISSPPEVWSPPSTEMDTRSASSATSISAISTSSSTLLPGLPEAESAGIGAHSASTSTACSASAGSLPPLLHASPPEVWSPPSTEMDTRSASSATSISAISTSSSTLLPGLPEAESAGIGAHSASTSTACSASAGSLPPLLHAIEAQIEADRRLALRLSTPIRPKVQQPKKKPNTIKNYFHAK